LCDAIGINEGGGHFVTLLGASGDRFGNGVGGTTDGALSVVPGTIQATDLRKRNTAAQSAAATDTLMMNFPP